MSGAVLNQSVLVLNRHWLAIHFCNVRRALCLLYGDLAKVVDEEFQAHSFESWRELSQAASSPEMVHTPRFSLLVPQVIVLTRYALRPPQEVKFSRRNIYLRDNHQCQFCGCSPPREELTIDHLVPRSRGGRTVWGNVVLACVRCNTKKGNRLPQESGMHPRRRPARPTWPVLLRRDSGFRPRSLWQKFVDSAYWNALLDE
jgi:5-methylcytosine-specific restriction endonuclease McrA